MSVGDVAERINNSDSEIKKMKRIIATSVMGAFLLAAPAVFASDKAPVDASAKGSVKTEAAPVVKKPEAATTAATPLPSAALKQEAAVQAKSETVKSSDKAAAKPEADKAATKAEAGKPEADKAAVKTEAHKADAAKAVDKNAPAKAATLDAKPAKPEAKTDVKPVTMKPAEGVKHTAEAAPAVKKPEAAAVKAN
jgi:hypothetical protein